MKKKFVTLCIFVVLMLVTISFASALNTQMNVEKKESPLYKIRTKIAIKEKISQIFKNIKTKFLGERIFFIPFSWLRNRNDISVEEMWTILPKCAKSIVCPW